MACRIEFERSAERELDRLDREAAARILRFLRDRLSPLDDPRSLGEALKGSRLGGLWKYRVGDYRIIAAIDDATVRVVVVRIGHRRAIYR
ncbi:type II toxin-antitoxin system RelE/ParE family toxin [Methylobacterium sp. WL30]|jgi:mRNA interferase RelE/StbE|uniref:type II toxin-antitoxin system RelE family toxin n=1 Tax=unclassified Methylobacterium TaxID=2615210 RepID=UPI0011C94E4A|nr:MULTISPECIES: type II toxin-antitoxin system RelE/ParE family toxin [unclassified Methylobacterium]RZK81590.1 MAG: type II toxin-antitoxin system RelE/ParE family toxin [Methylobacterium sp.]MCJ2009041.1 type II toxin-antitoxin system RelE/ParE family toxin [Methylobacterium sp. J-092]TXM92278.1 type II toxin-antitoxin system RelE/ParE family toxin [Methylobacterium sp. WL116]TXN36381.1 type II toxin-antitoxin system RelE/ParE family toxin [Methylobacterium sp. WL93]TXN51097.1 type II toxin